MRNKRRTLLTVSVAVVALTAPALAQSYLYRYKPLVAPRQPFSFPPVSDASPKEPSVSNVTVVSGHGGSVAEAEGGEYQICGAPDCSDQGQNWRSTPTSRLPMEFHARVRTLSGDFGERRTTVLNVGGWSAPYEVTTRERDTEAERFLLGSVADLDPSTPAFSPSVMPEGFDGPLRVAVENGLVSIDGAEFSGGGMISEGQALRVRAVSPRGFGETAVAVLTLGTGEPVTFEVTTRSRDVTPDPFEIAGVDGADPSSGVVSQPVSLAGFEGEIGVSAAGGDLSTDGGATWSQAVTIRSGQAFLVRAFAPAAFSDELLVEVSAGEGNSATFAVRTRDRDVTADPIEIAAVVGADPSRQTVSRTVTVGGFDGAIPITVEGGEISLDDGQTWLVLSDIASGAAFSVRTTAAPQWGGRSVATVRLGSGLPAEFVVVTRAQDTEPEPFEIASAVDAEPGEWAVSETVAPKGYDGPVPIVVSGGELSVDGGGEWAAEGTLPDGGKFVLRAMASAGFSDTVTAEVTVGTAGSVPYAVTTRAQDDLPDGFGIASVRGVAPSTQVVSAPIVPKGFEATVPVSATGGLVSTDGGVTWGATAFLDAGGSFLVRVNSSPSWSTSVRASITVGSSDPVAFEVTTKVQDTKADAFEIAEARGVEPSTGVVSEAVVPVGYEGTVSVRAENGLVSIGEGPWLATASIRSGQSLRVRVVSPSEFSTSTTASVTVGDTMSEFTATTRAQDVRPDAFGFASVPGTQVSTTVRSASVTPAGYEGTVAVRATGGTVSVEGGPWTTSTTMSVGESLQASLVSDASYATSKSMTVAVGDTSGGFTVTTKAQDMRPDAFYFVSASGADPSTAVTSPAVEPDGYEGTVAVRAIGGTVSVDGGPWTASTTMRPGQSVRASLVSDGRFATSKSATVTVGETSADYTVTTRVQDTTPDPFSIPAGNNAPVDTTVTSAAVRPEGFEGAVPVYVSGGQVSVNGGASWGISATLRAGESFQARLTSSSAYGDRRTANVTVGDGAAVPFHVTTRSQDTTPDAFSFATRTGVARSSTVDSAAITPRGYDGTVAVSASGGSVSVAGGSWTTSTSITEGQSIVARVTASSSYSTARTVTVAIGGSSGTFTATTQAAPSSGGGGGGGGGGSTGPSCSGSGDTVNNRNYYSHYAPDVPKGIGTSGHSLQYVHWFQFGATERRASCWTGSTCSGTGNTLTNQRAYMALYPDLQAAYGSNPSLAYNHWLGSGRGERRLSCWGTY